MTDRHYDLLLAELQALQGEFASFVARQAFLEHDLIWGPDSRRWEEAEYASFVKGDFQRNRVAAWNEWSLWPSRRACSRYWSVFPSAKSFIPKFAQMAERSFAALKEIRHLEANGTPLPQGFAFPRMKWPWIISGDTGEQIWLQLIHEWAFRFPTTRLQGACRWWNFTGPPDADPDAVAETMTIPAGGGMPYHSHPVCNTMNLDVFASSEEFLRSCLTPDETLPVGVHDGVRDIFLPRLPDVPVWISESGELWFRNEVVKHLSPKAVNQRKVLGDFEEQGWPQAILNPFAGLVSTDDTKSSGHVSAQKKMDDTITSLNKDQLTAPCLHFGIANKKEVYWEVIEQQ